MTKNELQSKLEAVLYLSRSLNICASSADVYVTIAQSLIEVLGGLEKMPEAGVEPPQDTGDAGREIV